MEVVLFGASGLVGSLLMQKLANRDLAEFNLTAVGRRACDGTAHQRIAAVADWPAIIAEIRPAVVISALGTTIRKAGSQQGFAAIDRDAVVAIAKAAKTAGTRQFVTISSVGANAAASSFYLATKGIAEDAVRAMKFERLDIFRPGLLVAERPGDPRLIERMMIAVSPMTNALTPRRFDRYRAIAATDVADAIMRVLGGSAPGTYVHHNRDMLESRLNPS